MKKIIRGMFIAGILFCGLSEIYAQCNCDKADESAYNEFKCSRAVFVGEVAGVKEFRKLGGTDFVEFDVTFRVTTAWKNDLPETLTVRTVSVGESGLGFREKQRYLIYAHPYKDTLWAFIGYCTRTRLLSDATGDIKEFRLKGEKPKRIVKSRRPVPRRSLTTHSTRAELARLLSRT